MKINGTACTMSLAALCWLTMFASGPCCAAPSAVIEYDNGLVTLDVRNTAREQVLWMLAEKAGVQLIVLEPIAGVPVELSLEKQPLESVLGSLLKGYNYAVIYPGEGIKDGYAGPWGSKRARAGAQNHSGFATDPRSSRANGTVYRSPSHNAAVDGRVSGNDSRAGKDSSTTLHSSDHSQSTGGAGDGTLSGSYVSGAYGTGGDAPGAYDGTGYASDDSAAGGNLSSGYGWTAGRGVGSGDGPAGGDEQKMDLRNQISSLVTRINYSTTESPQQIEQMRAEISSLTEQLRSFDQE